jgi:hypothetical protein
MFVRFSDGETATPHRTTNVVDLLQYKLVFTGEALTYAFRRFGGLRELDARNSARERVRILRTLGLWASA